MGIEEAGDAGTDLHPAIELERHWSYHVRLKQIRLPESTPQGAPMNPRDRLGKTPAVLALNIRCSVHDTQCAPSAIPLHAVSKVYSSAASQRSRASVSDTMLAQ